jgi:electron transfer flavoprotein alpha subunit
MKTITRRDPRRPFVMTSAGLRRIIMTEGAAPLTDASGAPDSARSLPAGTALRTTEPAARHLLVLVRSEAGAIDARGQQCIAAAALIATADTAVVAAVLGEIKEDLGLCGADLVVTLAGSAGDLRPEHELAQISALIERFRPEHLLLPEGPGLGDLGRRLAVQLGSSIATHVVELDGAHVARYVPDARMRARRLSVCRPLPDILLLEPDAADSRLPFVGRGELTAVPLPTQAPSRYHDHGLTRLDSSQLRLEEADVIAAAGNGVTDVALFSRLARALGAATGASRVAVDDGRFSRDRQIGATGTTVSANLYLAIGISGAVQHLQGIKDCRHVIAINKDAGAPMIQRADLSAIGDAQNVMTELLALLESAPVEGAE